jgi:hypothetical protein
LAAVTADGPGEHIVALPAVVVVDNNYNNDDVGVDIPPVLMPTPAPRLPSPVSRVPYTRSCLSHSSAYLNIASIFGMPCFTLHAAIFALLATDDNDDPLLLS